MQYHLSYPVLMLPFNTQHTPQSLTSAANSKQNCASNKPQKTSFLSPSLSPAHHSYPAIALANSRAQVSAGFSIMRNTCIWVWEELPGRAALPQVSIVMPLSLRASWEPQKCISRWMYFLSLPLPHCLQDEETLWNRSVREDIFVGLYGSCATCPKCTSELGPPHPREEEQAGGSKQNLH